MSWLKAAKVHVLARLAGDWRQRSLLAVRRLAKKTSTVLVAGFLILTMSFASTALAQGRSEPVYLSDLKWTYASTGWVSAGGDPMPKLDASFTEGALKLQGRRFQKGLGTYPFSEIEYELGGRYRAFQAVVGIDDDAQSEDASVVFYVFVDDRLAFTSGVMRRHDAARRIEVSVLGADHLRLVVSDAGDGTRWDYADWAAARLVPASGLDRSLGALARVLAGLTQRVRQ
ncbi:MAG: NPCBM/NEW2 domain-containing protein, partial [Chloroflexi bacterium]|nr:NPCBM/NEW2 domain-containing protein [Chloroflexota bacterium]